MLDRFLRYINSQKLCGATDKILLAMSGGKDSMALLHLFIDAKYTIEVAHCNFKMRGEESDLDQLFVADVCQKHNIVCHFAEFETKKYAKLNKISTQMAARELRYNWFNELIKKHNFDLIATGHHLNDNVETLYLNLTKGTGPVGLKGIPARKNHIIRPLLFAQSSEILEYLEEKKINWREDASNQKNDYARNLIRNKVLPLLKTINPGIEQTQKVNISRFNALADIFEQKKQEFINQCVKESNGSIEISPFDWLNKPGFSLIIEECLKSYSFNYQQVMLVLEAKTSGKEFLSATHTLLINRDKWLVNPHQNYNNNNDLLINKLGEHIIDDKKWVLELITDIPNEAELKRKNCAYFDYTKIEWPITLRKWKEKDKFRPFGMNGFKLISDYLIDIKMSKNDKLNQYVMINKNEIIWLVSQRISEDYKVDLGLKSILKISYSGI